MMTGSDCADPSSQIRIYLFTTRYSRQNKVDSYGRWALKYQNWAKEANAEHAGAMAILQRVEENVAEKEALLKLVTDELQAAVAEKNRVEADAAACQDRLALSERLVEDLQNKQHTLVGDVLLSAAFVSYIGAFKQSFRRELWSKYWLQDFIEKEIAVCDEIKSGELTPKNVLTTASQQAKWANEGHLVDSISIENAAIVTLCIKWIKNNCNGDKELNVINLKHPRWLSQMIRSVESGDTVLIENVSESIDPSLDPIYHAPLFVKEGRCVFELRAKRKILIRNGPQHKREQQQSLLIVFCL